LRRFAQRVLRGARRRLGRLRDRPAITFSGPYPSWAQASRETRSFAAPEIVDAVHAATLAVKQGRAAYSTGRLTFAAPAHRWPLLAALLHVALQCRTSPERPIHILDFGGAFGAAYFQHRRFLDAVPGLLWSVVDLPAYVARGNADLADARLQFFDTIAAAAARAPVDAVLFCGSLEYVEDPDAVLRAATGIAPRFLIFALLHMTDGPEHLIKRQRSRPPRFDAAFALWFFSKTKLTGDLQALGYDPVAALPDGFLFERRAP